MNKEDRKDIVVVAQKLEDLTIFEKEWRDDWDKKFTNHEERIRVNEEFRHNVKGASMLLGIIATIISIVAMLIKFGVF